MKCLCPLGRTQGISGEAQQFWRATLEAHTPIQRQQREAWQKQEVQGNREGDRQGETTIQVI